MNGYSGVGQLNFSNVLRQFSVLLLVGSIMLFHKAFATKKKRKKKINLLTQSVEKNYCNFKRIQLMHNTVIASDGHVTHVYRYIGILVRKLQVGS